MKKAVGHGRLKGGRLSGKEKGGDGRNGHLGLQSISFHATMTDGCFLFDFSIFRKTANESQSDNTRRTSTSRAASTFSKLENDEVYQQRAIISSKILSFLSNLDWNKGQLHCVLLH